MATPTEDEMRAAGVRLGHLKEGEPIPPRLRGKLAKVVELAKEEAADDADRAAVTVSVVDPIADTYLALVERKIPDSSAARIVAALAPMIWRTTQGAAQP